MKRKNLVTIIALALVLLLTACADKAAVNESASEYIDAAKLLTEAKTTQFFTDEKVSEEDVEKILSAGVNAPSAMNTQPWHFTAVTDEEVAKKLADAMSSMKPPVMKGNAPENAPKPPEGKAGFSKAPNKAGIGDAPLTIVISCKEGSELDAGLAVQNMSAEAQLLGYGTKIMTAPTMALNNDEYKELLSVPNGQKIAAVLIVGKAANEKYNPDAVSSATARNPFDEVVTQIKAD